MAMTDDPDDLDLQEGGPDGPHPQPPTTSLQLRVVDLPERQKRKNLDMQEAQRRRIWDLRVLGHTTAEIAKDVGLSERGVRHNLKRAVAEMDATSLVEHEIHVDLARIEALIKAHLPLALGRPPGTLNEDDPGVPPENGAAFFLIKAFERKSKLLGLDAPKKVDIAHMITQWSRQHGYDPEDVIAVTATLLPEPGD